MGRKRRVCLIASLGSDLSSTALPTKWVNARNSIRGAVCSTVRGNPGSSPNFEQTRLALLWQILSGRGFPNQFFNDSWVVGFWRADHGWQDVGLERRAWTLAQAVSGSVGS